MFAMREIESSCIHSFGYDPTQEVLAVRLRVRGGEPENKVRNYRDVPAGVAAAFNTAPSVGKHWASNVNGKYDVDVVRVADDVEPRCAGANCNALSGQPHSTECLAEHARTIDLRTHHG